MSRRPHKRVVTDASQGLGSARARAQVSAFSEGTVAEAGAITVALFLIVALSVVLGAALPIALEKAGLGASNAATSIQVVMDVSGVLITCAVCAALLEGGALGGLAT